MPKGEIVDVDKAVKRHAKKKKKNAAAYTATSIYARYGSATPPAIPESAFQKNRVKRAPDTEKKLAEYAKPAKEWGLHEYKIMGIADQAPMHVRAAHVPRIVPATPAAAAAAPAPAPAPKKRLIKNADKPKAKKAKVEKPEATAHQRNKVTIRPASASKKLVITIKPQ